MFTSKKIAWFAWSLASFFYAWQFVVRVMPNIMMGDIMQRFQIDAALFGQFSGVYYLGYSLLHLPIGLLLDRFGARKVLPACILLTVAGLMPLIFSDNWIYPILGRFLIGIGSSAAILGAFKIIRMGFAEKNFTRMLSLTVTIGLTGAIYGGAPLRYMRATMGFEAVILCFALIGILLAIITYLIVPDMKAEKQSSIFSNIKTVLTNGRVMSLCCFAGMMVGPLEGFADVWGSRFLQQVYGLDASTAGYLPSMIFTGMCFGAPVFSLIAEKTKSYLGSIIMAGIVMFLCFSLLILGLLNTSTIFIGFILVGICCAYQIVAIYKATTYVSESVVGLTTAVANMIIMSFGYLFHTTIGIIVDIYGGPEVSRALIYGVGVIPALLIPAIAGFCLLAYMDKKDKRLR